jgi:hypothetical protein
MTSTTADEQSAELTHLEILRAYKEHLVRQGDVNVSPFAERVVCYDSKVEDYDVPELYQEVRQRIAHAIQGIHQGHPSQVVILAGNPGMGKSHLINHFRAAKQAEELGYVLVCNSNHWKVSEFEACLLDWILEAIVRPSPNGPHLLLEKVQDLAFEALRQILSQPGQIRRFEKLPGFWRGLWGRLGHGHERLQQRVRVRDERVFRELHFPRFAGYVCDRFLHDSGNPFHRYVLRVLLRYLFADEREGVLHWLRRREVDFSASTGAKEQIDASYKVIDTIKILVSRFTSEVSRNLSPDEAARRGKVFFFAFDQMEGRNELFERDEDWMKFFAQLSELYNTLPNVFVLFTMTLALRQRLYPQMEGQFKDRISRDPMFSLHRVENSEVLALYRRRVDRWLGGLAEVRDKLASVNEPCLPFTQEKVLEFSQRRTLRELLEALDKEFCAYFTDLRTAPRIDYLGFVNALRVREAGTGPTEYTANHLDQVKRLLTENEHLVPGLFGLSLTACEWRQTEQDLPALWMEFKDPEGQGRWVRIYLVRLPWHFNQYAEGCIELLHHLSTARNFLWLVRSPRIDQGMEEHRPDQVFARALPASAHTTVQALVLLLANREKYATSEQEVVDEILRAEIKLSYLGEMFQQVAEALAAQQGVAAGGSEADLPEGEGEPEPAEGVRTAEQQQGEP